MSFCRPLAVPVLIGLMLSPAFRTEPQPQAVAGVRANNPSLALQWQESYEDEAVRLLQEYLRIDTSNPPGNERVAAEFFRRLFSGQGIPSTLYDYAPGRANLYAVLKGDGSLRPIILLNHMDVVRAEGNNWRVPPFSGEILDGRIYGRGALDMKDEGLLQAMVMLIVAREHVPLKRDLIFLATSDEEVGDTGSAWLIANHPELVNQAEYLITEGGSNLVYPGRGTVYGIDVAEKAPFWIRMTATSRGGHGSIPLRDSAPDRLVEAMHRVVNWEPPIRLIPSVEEYFHQIASLEPEPMASRLRNIRKSLGDPAFARQLSSHEDFNYQLRDTVALTVLQGSPQTNVIPDAAYCELDVRLLPGQDSQAFLARLAAVVADNRIQLQPLTAFRVPNSSPADTSLYRIIEQVVRHYSPSALVTPVLNSGYTESQMYRPLGIHAYGFAPIEVTPEEEATEHAANERVPVEQIRRGTKMLYEIVARAATSP
jgi:acetylornithine deacetylase/succinyl-diaminopimelate desuccinylase-like protein